MNTWTAEELAALKTYYLAGRRMKVIGQLLGGRSEGAICKAITRLRAQLNLNGSVEKKIPFRTIRSKNSMKAISRKSLRRRVSVGRRLDPTQDSVWVDLNAAIEWLAGQNISVKKLDPQFSKLEKLGHEVSTSETPKLVYTKSVETYLVDQKIVSVQQLVMFINKRREELKLKKFLIDKITW